ncbi:DNA polymerase III subunit delta' [Melissococcus plutonius]|uniref:DNA polymerase III subunit delta' n=1 Tax=Melissococcus plutonius TaxID=33970 RepID=UPI00065E138A|nr:DNA polymerase III subunit delta' [Melissococcus plutonius]KMT40428.1 DNA polymerase III subunit delta' [Melissococcus plutonius]
MGEQVNLHDYQADIYQQLQRSFINKHLSHAYLFEGMKGTGKKECALWLTKLLFCTQIVNSEPCDRCNNCLRVQKEEHPDVLKIIPDGQTIKKDQVLRLKSEFTKSGMETTQKVFLIEQADKMNVSAANSLLKFLEEPNNESMVILETTQLIKMLPTIQSRCQILHFQPLNKRTLFKALLNEKVSQTSAELLIELTSSFNKAVKLSQDEWFNEARETIGQWVEYFKKDDLQAFIYVQKKMIKIFKEKDQQALSFDLLLAYFYQLLKHSTTFQDENLSLEKITSDMEFILQAKQKWEANVSWQGVMEQLALHIIHKNKLGGWKW